MLIVLFKSILCWWPHLLLAPLGYCFISHFLFLSLVFSTFTSLQPPLLSLNIYSYLPFLGKTVSSLKPMCCFCYQFVSLFNQIFWKVVYKVFTYFLTCSFLLSPPQSGFSLHHCWNCSLRHQWLLHFQAPWMFSVLFLMGLSFLLTLLVLC